jgi:hypothetical protein
LKELGLTSDVLRDLLHSKKAASPPKPAHAPLHGRSQVHWNDGSGPDGPTASGSGEQDDEKRGDVQAGVQEALDDAASELAEASEADLTEIEGLSEKARGKRKATRKRRVHATYEVRGTLSSPFSGESAEGMLTLRCYPLRRHRR